MDEASDRPTPPRRRRRRRRRRSSGAPSAAAAVQRETEQLGLCAAWTPPGVGTRDLAPPESNAAAAAAAAADGTAAAAAAEAGIHLHSLRTAMQARALHTLAAQQHCISSTLTRKAASGLNTDWTQNSAQLGSPQIRSDDVRACKRNV